METSNDIEEPASFIAKTSKLLIGDYSSHSLENRIFNASTLITFLAATISLIVNVFSGFNLIAHFIYLFFIGVFVGLYYLGRFKKTYKSFFYLSFAIIAISFLWFLNHGSMGTVPMIFSVAILIFTAVTKIKHHLWVLLVTLLSIGILVLAEFNYYDYLIFEYPDDFTHKLQMVFGLVMTVCVVFVFAHSLKKNFVRETDTIKKQERELKKTTATKDKLFSIISHDLRGPFNSIMGFSEIMSDEENKISSEDMRNYARMINNTATNTYRLLVNLLNWTSLNQGDIPFTPTKVQLTKLVQESIDLSKDFADRKKIDINVNIDENLTILADVNMFQVILRNLLSNAVKFTPAGGKVELSAIRNQDKFVQISVKDTGVGMSDEKLDNLFSIESQITSNGTDGEPSTGIGLLLCKGFVEKHNGKIWAESIPGKGSTLHFTISESYS